MGILKIKNEATNEWQEVLALKGDPGIFTRNTYTENPAAITLADANEYYLTNVSTIEFLWPASQYFECWITLTLSNGTNNNVSFPEDMRRIGDVPNWNTPGATFEISIKDKIAIFRKVVEPNVST